MCCWNVNKNGKKNSRFICLKCLKENCIGQGMYRPNTREKDHIKNLTCLCTKTKYKTKNLEVRWCDNFNERMKRAKEIRCRFYDEEGNYIGKYDVECIPVELKEAN